MTVEELRAALEGLPDRAVVLFPAGRIVTDCKYTGPGDYTFGSVTLTIEKEGKYGN